MKTQAPMAQARFGSLSDYTFDGLAYCQMVFDRQGQPVDFIYIEVNKNFEELTGLKDAVGKKVTELIPGIKNSNPELFKIYGRVALTGQHERFETYIESLARWFLVSVYSPKKEFFVAVFQNTTDQKQIEKDLENTKTATINLLEDIQAEKEKLAEAMSKDEAILASIGDGLIAVDQNTRVIFMNEAIEILTGWKKEELIGKSWFEGVFMKDEKGNALPDDKRPIMQAISHRKSTTTYYLVRKDKTTFPVAITATPIILNGEVVGAIGVYRDITKEIEIDKSKSEFVSLASHQLRTPLGIIKWYLEALENEDYFKKSPTVIRGYFDEVYKSNERVLSLVRDLLSVSRIEQGQVKNVLTSVDALPIVKEIVEQMQILARKKKVALHLTIQDRKIPSINIDIIRFHEVIENLIANAVEYTMASGIVDVNVKKQGNRLVISVKDTGIGISPADQKKLFTKFFRSEKAVGHNPEGSGLGLYLVKSYVEGWEGKISVESVEGKGSTFVVSLPISQKKNV